LTAATATGLRPPWSINRPATHGVILIDKSQSVQGYDLAPASEFRKFLNTVEAEALVAGLTTFQTASFADAVTPLTDARGFAEVLTTSFNGASTCLAAPWRLDSPGFRFIVTDGVPSAGASANAAVPCVCPDADPTNVNCVARAIADYAGRGNGVWMLALRATFAGTYFPEFPPKGGFAPARAVKRPIYIWIGGPDVDQGRRIVSRSLVTLTQLYGAEAAMALEVWPGSWTGRRPAPVTTASFRFADTRETRKCGSERARPQVAHIENDVLTLNAAPDTPQQLLPLRVPVATTERDLPGPITPLVDVAAGNQIEVTGARPIWWTSDSTAGCFELTPGSTAVWDTRAVVTARSAPLAAWSTNNDAVRSDLDKTLLLSELWQTTAQILAAPSRAVRFSFLRAFVR
jgi:hypothetical protein